MAKRRKKGRDIHGILLLDKPAGISSNDALQRVKHLYFARKAGHTGSLDQIATGMLPLCFGEATKLSAFLLNADKTYQATIKLGESTTTGDSQGEVRASHPVEGLERAQVEEVLGRFRGAIEQVPPMFSAIKHRGQPLYKLAHQGIEVERKPRSVIIHRLDLVALEGDTLKVEVHCSKGTYIRTLAEDIGQALGVGGHVVALRRTGVGPFKGENMVSMETLEEASREGHGALDALLLPMDRALGQCPPVQLSPDISYYLRMGQPVLVPHAPTEGMVRLYGDKRFIGVGEVLEDGRIAPRRLVNFP
ncbi:MAG: tRNA pseudouridine(55) synthase TruB [Gammaproteobacteria bacterium]|nr:MAG: tRNA pseudouridine(55) synthase TruB [Gammaproteobacteria bacterium]